MKSIKSLLLLTALHILFALPTVHAQWNEGVAAVKCDVHPWMNSLVNQHLKAIKNQDMQAYKGTFDTKGIMFETLKKYYKTATASPATYSRGPQSILGFNIGMPPGKSFNIGMPPNKDFIIIIIPTSQSLRKGARLPYDVLGISAELGAGLRKQGVDPAKSMGFIMNTQSKKIVNTSALRK